MASFKEVSTDFRSTPGSSNTVLDGFAKAFGYRHYAISVHNTTYDFGPSGIGVTEENAYKKANSNNNFKNEYEGVTNKSRVQVNNWIAMQREKDFKIGTYFWQINDCATFTKAMKNFLQSK